MIVISKMSNSEIKYVFANWKMNKTKEQARTYFIKFQKSIESLSNDVKPVLLIPFPFIDLVSNLRNENTKIEIGAQNVSAYISGALTGEVSAQMIKSVNASYCLVGHSERRRLFNEKDEIMPKKIAQLIRENITPILCIGENVTQYKTGETFATLATQLTRSLKNISDANAEKIIFAYEPLWAIGTNLVASSIQISKAAKAIRELLSFQYTDEVGAKALILYGGSVSSKNINWITKIKRINGVLVGGASLNNIEIAEICRSY